MLAEMRYAPGDEMTAQRVRAVLQRAPSVPSRCYADLFVHAARCGSPANIVDGAASHVAAIAARCFDRSTPPDVVLEIMHALQDSGAFRWQSVLLLLPALTYDPVCVFTDRSASASC